MNAVTAHIVCEVMWNNYLKGKMSHDEFISKAEEIQKLVV